MDLKTAYQLLDLPEGASREQVDKRYDVLMRQERRRIREAAAPDPIQERRFSEVTRAYRFILEQEDKQTIEELTEQQYGKYKRFSRTAQRIDHWITYYKWHTLGVIAAIGLIIYGVVSFVDYREEQARLAALPPVDLEAAFTGQFYLPDGSSDTEPVEAAMLKQMPEWKRIEATLLAFSMEARTEMDVALQQKAMVMLATERPDIYVMDSQAYAWIARTDVLMSLDEEAAGRFKDLLPEGAALVTHGGEESGEHVYGIDLTGSSLAKELPIIGERFIVGIRTNAERPEKALQLIETYLKAPPAAGTDAPAEAEPAA